MASLGGAPVQEAVVTTLPTAAARVPSDERVKRSHPVLSMVTRRLGGGVITLWAVSLIVFWATQALPGNAAYSILGNSASPAHVAELERQLHLNESLPHQYWSWLSGLLSGRTGHSLLSGGSVWAYAEPRLVNSAVLAVCAAITGIIIGVALGIYTAWKRGRVVDHAASIFALAATSLPEFVVAVPLILLFATGGFHFLPATSSIPPGTYAWSQPSSLVLPVATLTIVTAPYIYRMTRASMVVALESEYVEAAMLRGIGTRRILLRHALRNALPATIQVVGLCMLYLAGGVVIVETVFAYPGIGQGLVESVSARDVPIVQFITVVLALVYVLINIITDVIALVATPRRRFPR
jgi:peptide/nickel transport system permease protein